MDSAGRKMTTTNDSEEILATYSLCLLGPRARWDHGQAVPLGLASHIQEAEENITDLLPAGFRVVIREWNDQEETP